MKFFPTIRFVFRQRSWRRNFALLLWFTLILVLLITLYSCIFQWLMAQEGQQYSFITGVYWTITVMSTLGFGDITFDTDTGRLFSVLVLFSGLVPLLVIFPFAFIQFFYEPWMRAHSASRVPRESPKDLRGHVIITHYDVITKALIHKLRQYHYPYVVIQENLDEALKIYDLGIQVVLGDLDSAETYERVGMSKAAMVVSTASNVGNTSVAFTVRTLSPNIPIVAMATSDSAKEILKKAGSTHVYQLSEMMGQLLARRTNGGDAMAHLIGTFGDLSIAEATPASVMLEKTVQAIDLTNKVGVTVLGVWHRGKFFTAKPETVIHRGSILLLAGSKAQLEKYDILFCIYNVALGPVIIIGGGRVGRATARAFRKRELDYRIIEKNPESIREANKYILGDASDGKVLEKAGIVESPTVVITTHNTSMNLYLAILIRHLRPNIQIVSRAGVQSNIAGLHEAGTDFVMSTATMGANIIFNLLKRSDVMMVAEGFDLFKFRTPSSLIGKTISSAEIHKKTGCHIVAICKQNETFILPDSHAPLPKESEIILIGSEENEERFLELFGKKHMPA